MSTITERLTALRNGGGKALVPFFTAGYPDDETFLALVAAADEAGCAAIEIGLPFSDPVADGEAIQASSAAVLAAGMTTAKALALVARAKQTCAADIVLMGYLNPMLRPGPANFASAAAEAGATGVIVPDLPFEEAGPVRSTFADAGLSLIDLLAPTSGAERAAAICAEATGFVYLVSLTGVTGAATGPQADLAGFVAGVRRATDLPLYVGFGIDSPERAADVCRHADGVVIGSEVVRIIRAAADPVGAVSAFLGSCREALEERKEAAS